MKRVPLTEEYKFVNHAWRTEPPAQRFNPHKDLSVEELWEGTRKEGFDLSDITTHKKYRHLAMVNDEPVGNIGLKEINFMMKTAEIGYMIGEKHHRKGYGSRMVSDFLSEVFEKTELRRIVAYIHIDNIPSQKLVEKLGFVKEGHLRQHYLINGQPCDELFYGLLREEFKPVS
ncbi:MAG: GNAT family N-acetyltransferase [Bdellovibrionales bacterium]|nr:GNAT family N-acetyltransferase [Bdellovibrionales bacterium]NQZ17754.1 GNAT family N-acetyltransferase [Bdellovibrionales bacterium]